jgi:hypothetical protein
VRPHLIPPAHAFVALTAANIPDADLAVGPGGSTIIVPNLPSMTGDWILSTQNIDPAGHPFNVNNVSACQGNTPQACTNTLSNLHLRAVTTYQPAGASGPSSGPRPASSSPPPWCWPGSASGRSGGGASAADRPLPDEKRYAGSTETGHRDRNELQCRNSSPG